MCAHLVRLWPQGSCFSPIQLEGRQTQDELGKLLLFLVHDGEAPHCH